MSQDSDWAQLLRIACSLIDQVNKEYELIDHWTFGGGTAMMLQINHRLSHDVDIFIQDPQLLSYLDPSKQNFIFEIMPTDYEGDGTGFLKLAFEHRGEIDFIVAQLLTENPTISRNIEGRILHLETIPEIVTKKIVYRGGNIQSRDIFDIAASAQKFEQEILTSILKYPKEVEITLKKINKLNPDFIKETIKALSIKQDYLNLIDESLLNTTNLLERALR